jgi:DNA-binding GntR family transcriptional regulator
MAKRSYLTLVAPDGASTDADGENGGARTLIERAYAHLRDDIIEGALAPGEKLRVEHLKARYGVGAGTLREAITRLVSDALVVAEGQRGFRVAAMTIADLLDLTELRLHIEIDALRRSIRAGDDAWRARLQRVYEELSDVEQPIQAGDRKRWEALNTRFHEVLVSGHQSPWTLHTLRLLARQGERYRRCSIGLPNTGRDVHAEHRELFELAMQGNEPRAALALEAHIRATPDLILRAVATGTVRFMSG